MDEAKIVCLQCSLQVWASDSSSTSVGFLPFFEKYSRIVRSWGKSSARGPLRCPVTKSSIPSFPSRERSPSYKSRSTFSAVGSSCKRTDGTYRSIPLFLYSSYVLIWTRFISGFESVAISFCKESSERFPHTKKNNELYTDSPSLNLIE